MTDHDRLELLGDTDRDHAGCTGGLLEEGTHDVDLALVLLELEQGDAMAAGEGLDGFSKVIAEVGEERGRGDGITEMAGEEGDDLAADLKGGDVGIEVDTIEALKVEDHVLIEELVEVGDGGHGSLGFACLGMATKGARTMAQAEGVKAARRAPAGFSLDARTLPPRLVPARGHLVTPLGPLPARSFQCHQARHSARRSEAEPH